MKKRIPLLRVSSVLGTTLSLFAGGGCGFHEPNRTSAPPSIARAQPPVAKKELVRPAPAATSGRDAALGRADAGEPQASTRSTTPAHAVEGLTLYRQHCAACHGDQGDGNGPAARFLYPRPRNFREGRFRLVTTSNAVPSRDDLIRVLTRGLPGSAMFPFGHLPEDDRRALVDVVGTFVHDGVVDRLKREAAEFNEEVKPDELASALKNRMDPGPPITVPTSLPQQDKDSLARGRTQYRQAVRDLSRRHGQGRRRAGAERRVRHADPAPGPHTGNLQGRARASSSSTRESRWAFPALPCPRRLL